MKNHLLKCEAYLAGHGAGPVYHLDDLEGSVAPDTPLQGLAQQQQQQPQLQQQQQLPQQQHLQQHLPQPPLPPPPPPHGVPGPDDAKIPGPSPSSSHPQDPTAGALAATTPSQPNNNTNSSSSNINTTTTAAANNGVGPASMTTPASVMTGGTPTAAAASLVSAKAAQTSLEKVRQAMGRSTRRLESLEAVLKTQVQDGMHNAATHVRAALRDERDRLFKLSQNLVRQESRLREAQNAVGGF